MKYFYCFFIKRRFRPLLICFVFILSRLAVSAQCDQPIYLNQTSGPLIMCGPTTVTLSAEAYPDSHNGYIYGSFRWYYQESGGQPFQEDYFSTSQYPVTASAQVTAAQGVSVWVSVYDAYTGCESQRTEYPFYIYPTPALNFDYAYVCGNVGHLKMTSNLSGVDFYLYKYGNSGWEYVQANNTGVFEFNDFDPYAMYGVAGYQNWGCGTQIFQVWFDTYSTDPPDVTGNLSIYTNTSTTLRASTYNAASNYRWYNASGGLLYDSYGYDTYTTPPLSTSTFYSVRWYVDDIGGYSGATCVSQAKGFTVQVSPPPQPVNCEDFQIDITQTSTPFEICQPQTVTLTAKFYPDRKNGFTNGRLKWWTQETGGQPFEVKDIATNIPGDVTSSVDVMAGDGVTIWASWLDYWTGCESPRRPYTFYITPTPAMNLEYAYGCGSVAKVKMTSPMQGIQFSLYKGYNYITSNYTGIFEITDYEPGAFYSVVGWNGGCATGYYQIWFQSFTTTAPDVTGNLTPAVGTSTTLNPSNGDVFEYRWTDASGNVLYQGYDTYTTPPLTENVYTYTVRAVTEGDVCIGDPKTVTVTVNLPTITYSPSLYNSTSFNSRTIDLGKPVGKIPGEAGTTGSGGATYSIPVYTPPGTNKVAPNIAVSYSSQAGNGVAGLGWNISGLSVIGRTGRNLYHNGIATPVALTDQDAFVLDGMRLNAINGANGANGTIYAGENETYSQIISYGGTVNNPDWFKVIGKDGSVMEYGNSTDSRILTDDGANVVMWRLNRIIDVNGNYVDLKYANGYRDSRIDEIKYTGNLNTSLAPYNAIKFNYRERTDAQTTFTAGASFKMKHLLNTITVSSENNLVKTYQFTYGYDYLYSLLKEVTETAYDGSSLNSTIFLYGDQQAPSLEFVTSDALEGAYDFFSGDFDADGKTDILAANAYYSNGVKLHSGYQLLTDFGQNSATVLYMKDLDAENASTSTSVAPTGSFSNFLTSDYNGDGRDDVMHVRTSKPGSAREFYTATIEYTGDHNSSTGWTDHTPVDYGVPSSMGIAYKYIPANGNFILPGDFDGDGNRDFILLLGRNKTSGDPSVSGNYVFKAFLTNTVTGEINQEIINFGVPPNANNSVYGNSIANSGVVMPFDFDGDGKDELLVANNYGSYVVSINRISATTGYSFSASSIAYSSNMYGGYTLFPGDFNGDGKTDFLARATQGSWWLEYSTGKGFVEIPFSFSPGVSWSGADNDHKIVVSDFNGDGKSDILHGYTSSSTGSTFNIYYSNGTISSASFQKEVFDFAHTLALRNGAGFVSGDFNGDGRSDIMNRVSIHAGGDLVTFNANRKERFLSKVKDGYNGTYSFQYKLLTDKNDYPYFYNRTVSLDGPENTPPFSYIEMPIYAVSAFTKPNGLSGSDDVTTYRYENAVLHRKGRGFLGYKKVITNEVTQGITSTVENQINTDFAILYTVKQSFRLNANNALLRENSASYTFVPLSTGYNDPKRFFQKTDKTLSVNYLTGSATESVNTYGNYGNVDVNVKKTGTPSGSTVNALETVTTTTTFTTSNTPVPSLPEQVTVTRARNGAGSHTDVTRIGYSAGLMTTKTSFYGLAKAVTTIFGHDGFGNVTSTNTSAVGVAPRITNTTYDSKGRFTVTKEMAAGTGIAQTESFIYDGKWGSPLSSTTTDCITSTFEYDAFGRQKKAISPVFTANFSMDWDVSGNKLYYCLTDYQGGKPDTKVWFDMLDREVTKQVAGFNNQWLTTNTSYDIRGNEASSTNAYYSNETPITTTKLFDAYNRAQTVSNGINSVQYTYSLSGGNLQVTTTDQSGHANSKTTDAAGRLIASNDKGGDLYFSYDARGLQTETKHGSTVLFTSTYDDYGHKISQIDMNAGTITYVYDAFSQLISETDAGNHTHQMAYDELGRLISRQEPDGTTTLYEYYKDNTTGCSNNNLKKSTGFNGVIKEYGYDNLLRITTETSTIDNVPYVTTYGYDTYSNVNKVTYPSGVEVNRVYDVNGNLTQVTGGSPGAQTTLFNASAKNGSGMYTAYTLANNRTSQLTFENGFPKHFYTQNIQDLNFTWDYANKNLTSRQDYLKGVTENFQYDALNRLTQSAINGQTPIDITYDGSPTSSMGNIAAKTDAGNYTYRNDKKHAVAYITNPTAISNSTIGQVITFTPFLKTATISENDYQIAFTYGADYQRVKSVLQYQNAVTETKIFVGEYEKFTDNTGTKEIHYIQGGNGLCAIIVKENGGNNIYVPYTDYLGSVLTVTDVSGNVVSEQNFDPWGRKRNPQDWTYNNIPTVQPWLYRGFTGHEHLPQFALINMNGRLYDPIQGRMISPDVYVAGQYGTQGYNRYSYGNNNPLSFVDPDGNFVLFAIGNLISHAIRGDVRDIGDAFHYLGQGAVAGLFTGGMDVLPLINPLTWISVASGLYDGIINGDWSKLDNAGRIFLGNYYLDENRSFWDGVWQGVSRHTREIIQTTIGYSYTQARNYVGNVDRVTLWGGATWAWRFNRVNDDRTGVTMGSFINMRITNQNTNITSDPLYMHEYGHTLQSMDYGFLYPFLVMIPSPISAAGADPIPGFQGLDTHDTRVYEMEANRYAAVYFRKYFNIDWTRFEPANSGTYPRRWP